MKPVTKFQCACLLNAPGLLLCLVPIFGHSQSPERPALSNHSQAESGTHLTNRKPLTVVFQSRSRRRGYSYNINWDGGDPRKNITIELIMPRVAHDQTTIDSIRPIATVPNTGKYIWSISRKQKLGVVQLKISCGEETCLTEPFHIRRKVPTGLKAGIAASVVVTAIGAAYFVVYEMIMAFL